MFTKTNISLETEKYYYVKAIKLEISVDTWFIEVCWIRFNWPSEADIFISKRKRNLKTESTKVLIFSSNLELNWSQAQGEGIAIREENFGSFRR